MQRLVALLREYPLLSSFFKYFFKKELLNNGEREHAAQAKKKLYEPLNNERALRC